MFNMTLPAWQVITALTVLVYYFLIAPWLIKKFEVCPKAECDGDYVGITIFWVISPLVYLFLGFGAVLYYSFRGIGISIAKSAKFFVKYVLVIDHEKEYR